MIDVCKRLIRQHPSLSLGIGGMCVIISPLPVAMNLKLVDEHILSTRSSRHPLEGLFGLIATIVSFYWCVAVVSGAGMIAIAIIIARRRLLSHGNHQLGQNARNDVS